MDPERTAETVDDEAGVVPRVPDTASKAYIDGVRAIACDSADGSPELVAAMAGGWNAQLIIDAPYVDADASPSPSSSRRRPPATSLALAAAARRTGGRYARLDVDIEADSGSSFEVEGGAESAMAPLEGVDLLVLDARRRDTATVLRTARPGPRGMVVVRHGDTGIGGVRQRAAAPPWGMAARTRVVRAAYLPIGAGGVEVLHVGVCKGPSLPTHQQSRRPGGGRGGGSATSTIAPARSTSSGGSSLNLQLAPPPPLVTGDLVHQARTGYVQLAGRRIKVNESSCRPPN